ncbi:hypothetical protein N7449_007949 [Penicillium cf. viridicatum]|uniref:Uncharacterized protein n=1 Tax=Penicillium cf. viridicatum TaxID=2972119 RepID=A0A9W9MCJ3_9EURO|nr:hypothetical protein N7449_007949 [Penicillium cf. viridicatum]
MNVKVRVSKLKECVLVFKIETKLNGWSWAGLVVARLSMGVRKQEHDVDLQCSARFFWGPRQAYRIFFCLAPLGAFGWLMGEARDSKGFIPLFRKARYGLDSLLS